MTWLLDYIPAYVLTLARVTAMITAMMFLGTTGDSRWPRVTLAITLSVVLFLRRPEVLPVTHGVIGLGFAVMREVALGLTYGFAIQLIFVAFRMSGSLIGHEMGFTMSQVVDPTTGVSSPVVGRFFETLSFLFVLTTDAHHEAFRILAELFRRTPVGREWKLQEVVRALWQLAGEGIELAILIATPIYACMILVTVVMVVLARAVPQINLMEFGYAIRIVIALGGIWIFLSSAAPYIYSLVDRLFAGTREMIDIGAIATR